MIVRFEEFHLCCPSCLLALVEVGSHFMDVLEEDVTVAYSLIQVGTFAQPLPVVEQRIAGVLTVSLYIKGVEVTGELVVVAILVCPPFIACHYGRIAGWIADLRHVGIACEQELFGSRTVAEHIVYRGYVVGYDVQIRLA